MLQPCGKLVGTQASAPRRTGSSCQCKRSEVCIIHVKRCYSTTYPTLFGVSCQDNFLQKQRENVYKTHAVEAESKLVFAESLWNFWPTGLVGKRKQEGNNGLKRVASQYRTHWWRCAHRHHRQIGPESDKQLEQ